MNRIVRGLVLAAGVAASFPSPLHASESEMFLSWRAPYGEPRATDVLVADCRDTTREDTLYLSFQIGELRPALARMNATVTFTVQASDTLLPFWSFQTGSANQGSLLVDFAPFEDHSCPSPWGSAGDGDVRYDHRTGRGRLVFKYALPPEKAQSLRPNARYCFARIRIHHRRADLGGCTQPVCVEWADARLGFATGRERDLSGGRGRAVTWNLPPGASCGSRRWDPLARPWQPKARTPGSQDRN